MWKAKTKDGQEVSELSKGWSEVEDNVTELLLITNQNQIIYLPKNMEKYVQFKTGSADIGSDHVQIESRSIGFRLGRNIVLIRVDEKTNNIRVEVQ
jgi:hypothetical protein